MSIHILGRSHSSVNLLTWDFLEKIPYLNINVDILGGSHSSVFYVMNHKNIVKNWGGWGRIST